MKELILTGIKELWPQDESNAIFLGPWCFAGNHKYKFWDQKDFTIAPSPWKNPQDILQASLYIDSLIDRIIPHLSILMNNFHAVKYSERFWKIYTIVWLTHWLGHCYDRYMRLKYLEQAIPEELSVKILNTNPVPVRNFWDYMKKMTEGHYCNLLMMSDIIKIGQFKFNIPQIFDISYDTTDKKDLNESIRGYYKDKSIKKIRSIIKNFSLSIFNKLYSGSSLHLGTIYGISNMDKLFLQFSYDPLFLFKKGNKNKLIEIKSNRYNFIKQPLKFGAKNEFEKIVEAIILRYIPDSLPTIYLRNESDKPKIKIWIGNDIYRSEKDAHRIAEICEYGGQWISSQHGGGYGQMLSNTSSKIDYECSNGFITWGWKFIHIYDVHYYPLPSPMLSKLSKHKEKKERLVFVSTMTPAYFYRFQSVLPEGQIEYLKNKKRFLLKISDIVRSKIKYRPYPYDYGIGELEFVSKWISPDQFIIGNKLTDEFQYLRLVVSDNMGTSFLEAFAMNAPTILFWNPKHFAVYNEVAPYFDKLRSSGILFDTPDAAAEKVNKIWDNVQGWWQQPEVQKAKDEFCYQFARTSKNWRKEWAGFLKELRD